MPASSEVCKTPATTGICASAIGRDLVALSAFDTLVRKMGYKDVLCSLSREELWILSFGLGDTDAGNVTRMLVEKTGVFVNPNTHAYVIILPNETLPLGVQQGREKLCVGVWSIEDPQIHPVTVAVRERLGVMSLKALKRLTLWWPRLVKTERDEEISCSESSDKMDAAEESSGRYLKTIGARDIVLSMVPTHSRKQGLLANPHYQCWTIIDRRLRPEELLRITYDTERGLASHGLLEGI